MIRSTFEGFGVAGCVAALLWSAAGCGGGGEPGGGDPVEEGDIEGELYGAVTLELTVVPQLVQCIRVVATGPTASVTRTLTVAAGASSGALAFQQLPLGLVTLDATAFNVACASIGSATPTWIADPVAVQLSPGVQSSVRLQFRMNNPVTGEATFIGNIRQIAAGTTQSYAVLTDGTVVAWGSLWFNPPAPTPSVMSSATDVQEIAPGGQHSCLRKTDGTIWCWGFSSAGQVGPAISVGGIATAPLRVTGISGTVIALDSGINHSCVLLTDGYQCWGNNDSGQFGNNGTTSSSSPSAKKGDRFWQIKGGLQSSCAVALNGTVRCFGNNLDGQIGDGTTAQRLLPTANGEVTSQGISSGETHACSVRADGTVRCWGRGGSVGDGTSTPRSAPTLVSGITNAQSVHSGGAFSCAVLKDRAVKCWGSNTSGQLGNNTVTNALSPVSVTGLTNVVQLAVGGSHACALTGSLNLYCWGGNEYGQLGDGTTINRFSPTLVRL